MAEPVIAVVGSLNIDLVAYTARVPGPGETVIGDRFRMGFGGKGANQAVMAARLGARVSMVGALGDDVYAGMTVDNLIAQGVDPEGAAAAVRALAGVAVVIGQLEIPQRVTAAAFGAAREAGATTVLNPAPAAALDPGLLDAADWLIPNETEFATLAKLDTFDPGDDAALVAYAERVRPRLVVTLGSRGAAVVGARGAVDRVPAVPVQAIDTTGAGDAFVGAFAYGLAAGLPELAAVRLGIACASDSVTKTGTQSSFATQAGAREILGKVLATAWR